MTGAQLVYDSHELWLERNEPHRHRLSRRLIRAWEARIEMRMIKRASGIITVSPGILEELSRRHRSADSKGHIVCNIPDSVEPIGDVARLLQATDERCVIAYSGRITTGRQLELLIQVSSELAFPFRLCLLGYGPDAYVTKLMSRANANNVPLEIIKPVHTTAVSASLALSTVVFVGVENVARSYELSLPNKFFEAILSGRPIVAPNLPEMVRFGKELPGIYWYESNTKSLRNALDSAEAAGPLQASSIDERMRKVCWNSEARRLVELYKSLDVNEN